MENFTRFTEINKSHYNWCIEEENTKDSLGFWTEGVISTIMGTMGVIGNVTTIIVLTVSEFRETFHRLLISLAVVDTLFIVCNLITSIIRTFNLLEKYPGLDFVFKVMLPLGSFFLITSIYITVSISIERYFGICYPIQSRVKGQRRLLLYLVPVIIFSLLYSLPRIMEVRVNRDGELNMDIVKTPIYDKVYKQYIQITFTVVIPLILLLVLNTRIFIAIRDSRLSSARSVSDKKEASLASILISIVIVFILCHTLRFIQEFYRIRIYTMSSFCADFNLVANHPRWVHNLSALIHPALVFNSSVNIVIYCLVGTRFRAILIRAARSTFRLSSTTSRDTEFVYLSRNRDSEKSARSGVSQCEQRFV